MPIETYSSLKKVSQPSVKYRTVSHLGLVAAYSLSTLQIIVLPPVLHAAVCHFEFCAAAPSGPQALPSTSWVTRVYPSRAVAVFLRSSYRGVAMLGHGNIFIIMAYNIAGIDSSE